MKKSTKAALLSALVFPGIGHIYLKRHVHGMVLFAGAASAIYYVVSVAVNTAFEVAEKIQSGDVPLDMDTITGLVSQQSAGSEQSADFAMIALIACWVVGIVDSYRQGRAQEESETAVAEKET